MKNYVAQRRNQIKNYEPLIFYFYEQYETKAEKLTYRQNMIYTLYDNSYLRILFEH